MIDAREYQAEDSEGDDELESVYVANGRLDLSAWGRDSVVLALPEKSSAARTAPASVPSAARTSTASLTATKARRSTRVGRASPNCETPSNDG